MLIINPIATNGYHPIEDQPWRDPNGEPWNEGWLTVPETFYQTVLKCMGHCDLTIQGGIIVSVIPREIPIAEPELDAITELQLAVVELYGMVTGNG